MIKMPRMSPLAEEAHTLFPSGRGTGGDWYFCDPPPPCCRPFMTSFFLACCRDQSTCHLCIVHCLHIHTAPTFWLRLMLTVPACPSSCIPSVIPEVDPHPMCVPCQVPASAAWEHANGPETQAFQGKIFCSALGKSHTSVAEWKPSLFLLVDSLSVSSAISLPW